MAQNVQNSHPKILSDEQKFILGSFLYGDILIREPALVEAIAYANAGGTVRVLYFDMDTTTRDTTTNDEMTFGEICCGVGHGSEQRLTLCDRVNYVKTEILLNNQ